METLGYRTTLVLGQVTVQKDLIFGYTVLTTDGWLPITDIEPKGLVQLKNMICHHVLCPADLSREILHLIKKDEEEIEKEKAAASVRAAIFDEAAKINAATTVVVDRSKDRLELIEKIAIAMKPKGEGVIADLGYCSIEKLKNETTIVTMKHREFSGGANAQVFENFSRAVDFILRRYW